MDRNAFLAIALSSLVFLGWVMWQAQNYTPPPEAGGRTGAVENIGADRGHDGSIRPLAGDPEALTPGPAPRETPSPAPPTPVVESSVAPWSRAYDLGEYRAVLDNRGASLAAWQLGEYRDQEADGGQKIELIEKVAGLPQPLATPFRELGLGDLSEVLFEVEAESETGASFVHRQDGVTIRKSIGFDTEGYGYRFTVSVENGSDRMLSPEFEIVWPVGTREGSDFQEQSLVALQEGDVERELVSGLGVAGFFSSGDEVPSYRGDVGFAGIDNKYFIAALLPDRMRSASAVFQPVVSGEKALLRLSFDPVDLAPGQSIDHELRGFAGPKRNEDLSTVSDDLALSVNRGYEWITPLTRFFEWALAACYSFIPNYGLAIIVLTILVRLVMAPLMTKQMRSMERMRALQPKLKEIQEKHGDDKQKQSEATMALYRSEGVNPLAGCLPMLLQFPVFIGLFYALQSSFELRHAGFMLWMTDLSMPESLFTLPGLDLPVRVLPLIMGASMVLQQRITPTTGDPAQAKMMMTVMPIMFTVLFYQFPSGLVLYWMVSNLLGIGHQLLVGRNLRAAAA